MAHAMGMISRGEVSPFFLGCERYRELGIESKTTAVPPPVNCSAGSVRVAPDGFCRFADYCLLRTEAPFRFTDYVRASTAARGQDYRTVSKSCSDPHRIVLSYGNAASLLALAPHRGSRIRSNSPLPCASCY